MIRISARPYVVALTLVIRNPSSGNDAGTHRANRLHATASVPGGHLRGRFDAAHRSLPNCGK